jgi:alpha-beta hydrolase superfamily lysophospholipase/SAM-dependent methyltransferase
MKPTSHTFASWDQSRIHYLAWNAEHKNRALVFCHRGHEYGGRWQETVEKLGLGDFACFAWDARGHGQSDGSRGHAPNVGAVARDLDYFIRHLSIAYGIAVEDMVVVGHSVGAVIVSTWVHDYAPPIRGMVLGTPAFEVKLYVPFAIPLLRLRQLLFGAGEVRSYVKAAVLTHDKEEARKYAADSQIFPQISVQMLLDLYDTSQRILQDAGAITVPTLLLSAGSDWVVRLDAQQRFFEKLSSPQKIWKKLSGFYHAIFHEKDRSIVVDEIRAFVNSVFSQPCPNLSLLDAHQMGYTKKEYDDLCSPNPFPFQFMKWVMQSIGNLSEGIKLGWKTGFDSGVTLDYVYRNQPAGNWLLGKWFDRCYLESIGWKGIRQRKVHLEARLSFLLQERLGESGRVDILDIATGGGRYILETLKKHGNSQVSAYLQDYKTVNIEAASALRDKLQIEHVTIRQGDAFNLRDSVPSGLMFDIVIVSGLYELFPDNTKVLQSLKQVFERLRPGGALIYTNQPWHPQIEFIARVLSNREGQMWIMRRRTQVEMDQLVASVGLKKEIMDIDQWGIFTVSVARKH